MNYKNININELGLKQRISYRASRVALFVPRLLAKLSTKLAALCSYINMNFILFLRIKLKNIKYRRS